MTGKNMEDHFTAVFAQDGSGPAPHRNFRSPGGQDLQRLRNSEGLSRWLAGLSGHLRKEGLRALGEFFPREVFLMGRDHPLVAERVSQLPAAICIQS